MEVDRVDALRIAVQSATSPLDLGQRLAMLQGPQVEPSDQGLSLRELRQRVYAVLDRMCRCWPGARRPRAVVSPEEMMQRLVEAEQGSSTESQGRPQ